jgi:hypothetical protein
MSEDSARRQAFRDGHWTKEPPTYPWWFWYRSRGREPLAVRVFVGSPLKGSGLQVMWPGTEEVCAHDDPRIIEDGEWWSEALPIPPGAKCDGVLIPDRRADDSRQQVGTGPGLRCYGTGYVDCYCGGDLCVCDYNGTAECLGCPDCEPPEEEDR